MATSDVRKNNSEDKLKNNEKIDDVLTKRVKETEKYRGK